MRKHAILFVMLSIFSLTSCDLLNSLNFNGPRRRSSREQESQVVDDSAPNSGRSSSSKQTTSKHVHTYGEWVMVKAPTCTDVGVEERRCECGECQTRSVQALGHSFDEFVYSTATCSAEGYDVYRCTRCGATTEIPAKADHEWGAWVSYSPYAEGYVGYNVYECIKCNWYQKIEIKALDGTLGPGSSLKSSGYGFMKLAQNGGSMSWIFNLDIPRANGAAYHGMLYQRGYIDYVTNNNSLSMTYLSGKGNSPEEGNFRVEVNGVIVDKTPFLNLTYGEMTANGEDSSSIGDDLSPIGLCPIGEVYLNHGYNEIKYTRLDSFGLIISDLVLVVEPYTSNHVHQASAIWSSDENQHWHACANPGCTDPNYKMDVANHSWGAKYDEVTSTCVAAGSYKKQCSVCGYVRTYTTSALEHTWYVDTNYQLIQPTKTSTGRCTYRCSVCNTTKTETIVYGQTKETALTVDEAIEVGMTLAVKGATDGYYFVSGVVSEILQTQPDNNIITLWLSSSSQSKGYEFYRVTVANGIDFNSIKVGATVLGFGKITRYQENAIEFSGQNCRLEEIIAEVHSHVSDSSWSYDENQHWHQCLAPNCTEVGNKLDVANHTFGEPYDMVASTCTSSGSYKQTCSVCGYTIVVNQSTMLNHDDEDYNNGLHNYCYNCGAGNRINNIHGDTVEHNMAGWDQREHWYDLGVFSGNFSIEFEFNMKGCQGTTSTEPSNNCWKTVLPVLYNGDSNHVFRMDWFGFDNYSFASSSDHGNCPEGFDWNNIYYAFSDLDVYLMITKIGANVTLDWVWTCAAQGVYYGESFDYHQSCVLNDSTQMGVALASEFTIFTVYRAFLTRL